MASSSVVSYGDLQRMRELASLSPDAASLQRKEQLKQQSQARYKNWNNTLEALRAKKEAERQKRLEDIEAAFAKIDAEEAAYQTEQRQKAIERADNIRYQQSEAARELHSSVLLSQVLKEREVQLDRKKKQQQMQQRIEDGHLANQRQRVSKLEEREKSEQQKAKELSHSMATTQIEQLEAFQQKRLKEMEEEFKEGERIRTQALADAKAAEEDALRREQEKRRAAKAFQETNQHIQAEKKRLAELEREEMDRLAAFHAEKLRQDDLRKQQAEEAFQKRMKTRGELLEQQMQALKAEREKEEALLKQHIEEMGRRQEQKATNDAVRAKQSDHNLHLSRQEQIKRKQEEAEATRRAGQELAQDFRKKNEEGLEQERMEREKQRQEALKLQSYLKAQMAERESIEKARVVADVESAESLVSKFATEDQKFEKYAQSLQDKLQIAGKEAIPVQLVVSKLQAKRR